MTDDLVKPWRVNGLVKDNPSGRIEELEANLAKAVETLQTTGDVIEARSELFTSDLDLLGYLQDCIRTTLEELKKGEKQ